MAFTNKIWIIMNMELHYFRRSQFSCRRRKTFDVLPKRTAVLPKNRLLNSYVDRFSIVCRAPTINLFEKHLGGKWFFSPRRPLRYVVKKIRFVFSREWSQFSFLFSCFVQYYWGEKKRGNQDKAHKKYLRYSLFLSILSKTWTWKRTCTSPEPDETKKSFSSNPNATNRHL